MSSTVIPAFRARDGRALVSWLEETLGFTRKAVHEDGGRITHAELVHGSGGMVMVGDGPQDGIDLDRTIGAQSIYILVEDGALDGLWERARGGTVVRELRTEDYGGRTFAICDPEGNTWSVGSYDPWAT